MKYILLFLIAILTSCSISQRTPKVTGMIFDSISQKPVAGAEIKIWKGYVEGYVKETVTDSAGYFVLNRTTILKKIADDRRVLGIRYIVEKEGYQSKEFTVLNEDEAVDLASFFLKPGK